jgi:hypothetical protein
MAYGADPGDAGRVRLSNTDSICWEAATPGTDLCLTLNSSNEFELNAPLNLTGTPGPSLFTGVVTPSAPAGAEQWYFYADSVDNKPKYIYNGESEQEFYTTANPQTSITGNAGTATALASNPSDCAGTQFATAIAANGNLTCAALVDADIPNTITINLAATATALAANGANCSAGQYPLGIDASGAVEGCTVASGSGTVTNTGGNLTANAVVLGAGTVDTKVVAGIITDGTSKVTLGVAGTSVGSVDFKNATSGTVTLAPVTGALGTVTVSLPATTGTVALTSGNVATATALAANGANCSAGSYPLGVDASGAVESCTSTASETITKTNLTLDAEDTGNVITIPRRYWLPAAGCNNATAGAIWDLPATNPAVAACVTGTNTQKGVLNFTDGTALVAQNHIKLPSTWTGTVDANIKWYTSVTSGNVVWQLATICVADAETDDPAFNTASTVTDAAKGTTLQTNDAAITTVTVTGCAAGELMHLKITRDSGHASDTLSSATAVLIGVELVLREAI